VDAAYDLVYSFPIAEVIRDLELIDFGTEASRELLVEGWGPNQNAADGTSLVWSDGSGRSSLDLPIVQPRAATLRIRCQPPGAERGTSIEQSVGVRLNGVRLGTLELESGGWQEVEIDVPASAWRLGANRLELVFPGAAPVRASASERPPRGLALDRLEVRYQVGGARSFAPSSANADSEAMAAGGVAPAPRARGRRLVLPAGTGIEYAVELPPDAWFLARGIKGRGQLAIALAPPRGGPAQVVGLLEIGSGVEALDLRVTNWRSQRLSLLAWGRDGEVLEVDDPRIVSGAPER
jgi:hypothetical protein